LWPKIKNKFDVIAEVCMVLSGSASTAEERDTFLDFARKWKKMASEARRANVQERMETNLKDPEAAYPYRMGTS
jgi:hypothetical protein